MEGVSGSRRFALRRRRCRGRGLLGRLWRGGWPPDGDWQDGVGEEDRVAERHDRQLFRELSLLLVAAVDDERGVTVGEGVLVERVCLDQLYFFLLELSLIYGKW